MFVESSSFVATVGAGWAATEVTGLALGAVVAATPIGWVLIFGGLAATAAVAVAATSAGNKVRAAFGSYYDMIMRWLGGR